LAKYVTADIARKPGIIPVGIVMSVNNQMANTPVGDAIAARFKSENVETLSGVVTPAFVADGLFVPRAKSNGCKTGG